LRTKFVDVLSAVAPTPTLQGPGVPALLPLFIDDGFVISTLAASLIRLFNSVEHTGAGSDLGVQFYDKFSLRHSIATLLNYLFTLPMHTEAMNHMGGDLALKFINCVINDITFLVDEALSKAQARHFTLSVLFKCVCVFQCIVHQKQVLEEMDAVNNDPARLQQIPNSQLQERHRVEVEVRVVVSLYRSNSIV
jgi:hypothetical protein